MELVAPGIACGNRQANGTHPLLSSPNGDPSGSGLCRDQLFSHPLIVLRNLFFTVFFRAMIFAAGLIEWRFEWRFIVRNLNYSIFLRSSIKMI
jgi:hypothetical protein